MDGIYGYKESEIEQLIEQIKTHKGNLSLLFRDWAMKKGKAVGTVRNMYYAIAKKTKMDEEFCNRYFDGKILSTKPKRTFNECEKNLLLKKIDEGKSQNRSVRSVILELADGDAKKALRLQNKYRNLVKANPKLAQKSNEYLATNYVKKVISKKDFDEIREGINHLIARICLPIKRENQALREKLRSIQLKNGDFNQKSIEKFHKISALDFFLDGKDWIN